jgi:MFS family permease
VNRTVALRALVVIAGSDVLAMATWFSASAAIVPLAAAFGIASEDRGWITSAVQGGFVSAAVFSATIALADSIDPRTLIRFGILIAAAANAAIAVIHAPALLLLLRFLTGAGLALVYPPTLRLLTAWFPHNRGIVTGIAVGALTIGSFSPHLFSGSLPWRSVMIVASLIALLGIPLVSAVMLPPAFPRAGRFDVHALQSSTPFGRGGPYFTARA